MMPRALRVTMLLATIAMLAACAQQPGRSSYPGAGPAPSPGASGALGTLTDIRGPNAFYVRGGAGAPARAAEGQPVYEGDRIYTGPGTRMTLKFAQGGHAELDENTDPVPRFLADLGCLIVDLLRTGRMFVDGSAVCVGAVGTIARQDSQVVYDVRPGYAQITVAGGHAELRRPRRVDIPAGWRADASAREVMRGGAAYQLTRTQVEDAVRWTRWYQQRRPALPGLTGGTTVPPPVERPRSPPPEAAQPATPAPPAQQTAPPSSSPSPPYRAPIRIKPKPRSSDVIR